MRAGLFEGLRVKEIRDNFLEIVHPLLNIAETVGILHEYGIKCIVVTVGPVQVARTAAEIWDFDGYYGSGYEVVNGKFTGRILEYIQAEDKVDCLIDYCRKHGIDAEQCVSVGDGSTDIPVLRQFDRHECSGTGEVESSLFGGYG